MLVCILFVETQATTAACKTIAWRAQNKCRFELQLAVDDSNATTTMTAVMMMMMLMMMLMIMMRMLVIMMR